MCPVGPLNANHWGSLHGSMCTASRKLGITHKEFDKKAARETGAAVRLAASCSEKILATGVLSFVSMPHGLEVF